MSGCCGKSPLLCEGSGRADVKSQVSGEPWQEVSLAQESHPWLSQVAYTIMIFPVATCRLSTIFSHPVPYRATMAADSIFMLLGTPRVNVWPYTHPPLPSRLRERRPVLGDVQDRLPRPLADRGCRRCPQMDIFEHAGVWCGRERGGAR